MASLGRVLPNGKNHFLQRWLCRPHLASRPSQPCETHHARNGPSCKANQERGFLETELATKPIFHQLIVIPVEGCGGKKEKYQKIEESPDILR